MSEQVTHAVVLDKEPTYDAHVRVHLYTRHMGKISARATSARKITAKLGPHLEPLMVSMIQFAERGHLPQLTDAVQVATLPRERLDALRIVQALAPEHEPDPELWSLLISPREVTNGRVLAVLGYDPLFAKCEWCGRDPELFSLSQPVFMCAPCRAEFGRGHDCVPVSGGGMVSEENES